MSQLKRRVSGLLTDEDDKKLYEAGRVLGLLSGEATNILAALVKKGPLEQDDIYAFTWLALMEAEAMRLSVDLARFRVAMKKDW